MQSGDQLISYESHGMAMRGGSVSSHLKIGEYQSPLISNGEADILLVLAAEELPNVRHLLRHSGQLFINAEKAVAGIEDYQTAMIPASPMALEHNLPRAVNLIVAGFAASHPNFPYSVDQLRSVLEKMPAKETVKAANIAALELGCKLSS
jgi:indolepyruvate ferredoxin oxidoreductase beta subunit